MGRAWRWLSLGLLACGGEPSSPSLRVSVLTDFLPGVEFVAVEVAFEGVTQRTPATSPEPYGEGVEVVRLEAAAGAREVEVALLDLDARPIATRRALVAVERETAVTLVLTRSCAGVSCASEESCLGGRCVPLACVEGTEASCPAAACTSHEECDAGAACASARCEKGVCVLVPDASRCGAEELCHPERGCEVLPGAAPEDAGPPPLPSLWERVEVASAPAGRSERQMIYRSATEELCFYGGRGLFGFEIFADFWCFDGTDWEAMCDPCPPGESAAHGLAYDAATDRVFLVGNGDRRGTDHWVWEGGTWTQLPATPLVAAYRYGAVFVPDRDVLFVTASPEALMAGSTAQEWDGTSWRDVPLGALPGDIAESPIVFVPGLGVVANPAQTVDAEPTSIPRDELWAWDGSTWTRLCEGCTTGGRREQGVALDSTRSRILIAGGQGPSDYRLLRSSEPTWAYSPDRSEAISVGPDRVSAIVGYHAARDELILFGGFAQGCGDVCGDTLRIRFSP